MSKSLVCTRCEKEFRPGAWLGCEGNPSLKHVVESKTFYSESDRYQVNAIPQTNMVGAQGERINIPGIIITFNNGTFATTDPELQEVLSRRCPMTKEHYVERRMTPELKTGRDRAVISEQQALIEQLKARNAALEAAQRAGAKPEAADKSNENEADPVMAGAKGKGKTKVRAPRARAA